jgi:hypothetical protein
MTISREAAFSETRTVASRSPVEVQKEVVVFDPMNNEHRNAFRILVIAGKQTSLRFELEGFESVPSMMLYKMAVFGAGALDKTSEDTRANLSKRYHFHEMPGFVRYAEVARHLK